MLSDFVVGLMLPVMTFALYRAHGEYKKFRQDMTTLKILSGSGLVLNYIGQVASLVFNIESTNDMFKVLYRQNSEQENWFNTLKGALSMLQKSVDKPKIKEAKIDEEENVLTGPPQSR
jgi:hypothetical protein